MIYVEAKEFYIRAEDFVVVFIGPFPSTEAAQDHLELCKARGDSALMEVVTKLQDEGFPDHPISPEMDRGYAA